MTESIYLLEHSFPWHMLGYTSASTHRTTLGTPWACLGRQALRPPAARPRRAGPCPQAARARRHRRWRCGHLIREASLLDSRDRITAADDRDAARVGDVGQGVGNVEGALGEGLELEHAHGAVPDNSLAIGQLLLDHLGRLRAVVQAHPASRDVLDLDSLRGGVSGELVGDDNVGRQDEVNALLLGNDLELLGQLQLVLLDERRARLEATRLQESEDHAAANDDLVDLLHERLDNTDLRG